MQVINKNFFYENSEVIINSLKLTSFIGIGIYGCIYFYRKNFFGNNSGNLNNSGANNEIGIEVTRLDNNINGGTNNDSFIDLDVEPPVTDPTSTVNTEIINEGQVTECMSKTDELLGILYKRCINTAEELLNYDDIINRGGLDKDSWIDFVSDITEWDGCANIAETALEPFNSINWEGFSFSVLDPYKLLTTWRSMIESNKPSEIIKTVVDKILDSDVLDLDMPTYFSNFDIVKDYSNMRDRLGSDGFEAIINMEGAIEYFSLFHAVHREYERLGALNMRVGVDYIEIKALFSAVLALTLYKILKSSLPKNFYKKSFDVTTSFDFLSRFCVHDYFLLFKESFLSIIFDESAHYSSKNNAFLTIKRVIFNKINIQYFCPRKIPIEDRNAYTDEHLYFASMVYWLDYSHSISNAVNLSRPSHFTRNFKIEMDCWKSARQPGCVPFYEYAVMAGSIRSRGGPAEGAILPYHWNMVCHNWDVGHHKESFFHRFDATSFSSIQEEYFKQGSFSPMLKYLYDFAEAQKKNYKSLCISEHSKFLFRYCSYNFQMPISWKMVYFGDMGGEMPSLGFCRDYETFINFLSFLKRILPHFGWFFDSIPGGLDAALRHWLLRSDRKRHY